MLDRMIIRFFKRCGIDVTAPLGIGVAAILVALIMLAVTLLSWLWPRSATQAPTPSSGAELYAVVRPEDLLDRLPRPGNIHLPRIPRPELKGLEPGAFRCLLLSGAPDVGTSLEAYHVVARMRDDLQLPDLRVLWPKAIIAVPDTLPDGCGGHVVLFIDDIHDFAARDKDISRTLRDTYRFFAQCPRVRRLWVIATVDSQYVEQARLWLADLPGDLTNIQLSHLAGEAERAYIEALCNRLGLEADAHVVQALAEANDGTVIAIHDYLRQLKEAGRRTLVPDDVPEFSAKRRDYWRRVIKPELSEPERRVVRLLSCARRCRVPLHPWLIKRIARREDVEASRLPFVAWPWRRGRSLEAAMTNLAQTWIPRSEAGEFTPHNSRLELERQNIIEDACSVARALAGLCDDRPVRPGLREAYAGLESIFYSEERYDLLLPLLLTWTRTSIGPGKDTPLASWLGAQFQPDTRPPASDTPDWAALVSIVGDGYLQLTTGSRTANLQRAIECHQAALRVYTEDAFPTKWAAIQNSLGTAYAQLPTGRRVQNLHKAIECFQAQLRVYNEDAFLTEWATTQNNLGLAYSSLTTGDRAQNIQKAIECYQTALRVHTEDAFPTDWAMTQNNLGNAYNSLPTGDLTENLEHAIACYLLALRVYTEDAFPTDWAGTQNNLGTAYFDLPTGDRAENLEHAIECCQAALRVHTEDAFPTDWAMATYNLGLLYLEPDFPGDRAQNLRNAIECCQAALRVWTEDAFPRDWAMTQNNLGNAYGNLPTGDRAQNLQNAIECYHAALTVYTEDAFPDQWAMSTYNLGRTYLHPDAPGDHAENAREAVKCFDAALRVWTEDAFPRDHAQATAGLERARAAAGD